MGTTTTLLTFEEFERLPDQPGKRELLEGELIELPPAELKHNRIAHRIYHRLIAAVEAAHGHGQAADLGEVYHEMGYKLARNAYVQPETAFACPRGEGIDHAAQQFQQVELPVFETEAAAFNPREIKYIVYEPQEDVAIGPHELKVLALLSVERGFLKQLRHPENRIHRRTDFVRHAREEFTLGRRRCLSRLTRRYQFLLYLSQFGNVA